MIKQLKMIGQPEVKATLNEIITAKNYAEKKGRRFVLPNLYFGGITGTGKSHVSEKYAELFQQSGFQYLPFPPVAGWRFWGDVAAKSCTVDQHGVATAIPTIFFVDEAHEKSPIQEMIKLITGVRVPRLFPRNGVEFFSDPACHQWIFASDRELDPAQRRRLLEVPFSLYEKNEKKQLLTVMCEKNIHEQAIDYLEERVKPTAGDIKNVCDRLNLQPVDTIKLENAKTVVKNIGLFPQGLLKKDLMLMLRMGSETRPVPVEALKSKIGDVKTSATRSKLGTLMALELAETRRGGYTLTKKGIAYLKTLADLQEKDKKKRK
jgi:Holliday junction resolvasome RuvABC ATP-dependent DNA helicase subunit